MSKDDELVLGVDASFLKLFAGLPGFNMQECNLVALEEVVAAGVWRKRGDVEDDPTFLQLIPYTVITREEEEVLCYRRAKAQGDVRLRGQWSCGIGGHVNIEDSAADTPCMETLQKAAYREIEEELGLAPTSLQQLRYEGVLFLDDTPVNRVHLGVVFHATIPVSASIQVSSEIEMYFFCGEERLRRIELERWSEEIVAQM